MVKLRCIRHADILKRAYLCQVSDTGSPEPLVLIKFICKSLLIYYAVVDNMWYIYQYQYYSIVQNNAHKNDFVYMIVIVWLLDLHNYLCNQCVKL